MLAASHMFGDLWPPSRCPSGADGAQTACLPHAKPQRRRATEERRELQQEGVWEERASTLMHNER